MHMLWLVPKSMASWLRSISLVVIVLVTASVPSFAAETDMYMGSQGLLSQPYSGAAIEIWVNAINSGPALAGEVVVGVQMQELKMADYISSSSSQGLCSTALDTCVGLECQDVLDQPLEVSCDLGSMDIGIDARAWVQVAAYLNLPVDAVLTISADVEDQTTDDPIQGNNSITITKAVREFGDIEDNGDVGGVGTVGVPTGGCFIRAVLK